MTKPKISPSGGIKVIVLDSSGQPKVLGTVPVWNNPTPAQKWVMNHSGAELSTQLVYVSAEEEFSMENELSLQENKTKVIQSKYKVSIKEC